MVASNNFVDVVKFRAVSGGVGNFAVSAAVTGYQTPATAGAITATQYSYRAESSDLTQWEVGQGTYTSSNTTITRTPIFNSAGGSSAINFTLAPQVGLVALAEDLAATGTDLIVRQTNPQFTNNIGIGTPAITAFGINLAGTIDGTVNDCAGLQVADTIIIADNSTHTNVWGQFISMALQGGSSRVLTETGGLRILDTFLSSGASITTQKGIRVDNLVNGGTNYSIITNGAANTGLGTATPQTPLHVNRNVTENVAAQTDTMIHVTAVDGGNCVINLEVFQNGGFKIPQIIFRNARGTAAASSAIGSGDFLGLFGAQGYSTAFSGNNNCNMTFVAAENFTATNQGTRVEFSVTAIGTTSNVTGAAVHGSKGFSVGNNTDPGAGNVSATGGFIPGSFTVATLPAGATGKHVYCSDLRVFNGAGVQQGVGAGTGGLVIYNGTAWKNCDAQSVTAVA